VDAGIPETFVQQALAEYGLVRTPVPSGGQGAAIARPPGVAPAIVVKDGPKQKANPFFGTSTRIVVEASIEGEMPERDYDLVLDIIRREIGEVGQIGSVGRTFSWSVSSRERNLQISVMPRGGRTTIRVDEQVGQLAKGIFGGMMGGFGGGLGGAVMGSIMGATHRPLFALGAWIGMIATGYGGARLALARLVSSRHTKLHEVATQLANQIAESTSLAEPGDSRRRLP